MAFPETQVTLIRRLAEGSDEADWRRFISDYWRPVWRFAMRWGRLQPTDADDIASGTFEILIRNRLLLRWSDKHTARLRTLLCSVVRKQLANRSRRKQSFEQQLQSHTGTDADESSLIDVPDDERSDFEQLWIDEVLSRSLDSMRRQLLQEGKIDQFRVLYGRVCDGMTHSETAACLGVPVTTVEAWYKRARDRLTEALRSELRSVVRQYGTPESSREDFDREWAELAKLLKIQGGLEEAIRRSHAELDNSPAEAAFVVNSLCELAGSLSSSDDQP